MINKLYIFRKNASSPNIAKPISRFILIGADPKSDQIQNPGGQITASISLSSYSENHGYKLEIIDTTQTSFPIPSFKCRLKKAIKRFLLLFALLKDNNTKGVIIFASCGFSFYERICQSFICRLFGVKDVFFIRSGHFITTTENSAFLKFIHKLLLKIPYKIGLQGTNWQTFYNSIGVDSDRTILIHNWLPKGVNIINKPISISPINRDIEFVYIGWLVREKGIMELMEAISKLIKFYSFNFTFIGGGYLEKHINSTIVKNNWSNNIKSLGWKKHGEVLQYLKTSDVFVLPSYTEGFPNALIEAMANGLPAICSNVGGISDSLHNNVNGFLIPPKDENSITDAMKRYIVDPSLIALHSSATIEIVTNLHDLDKNCEKLFNVFL